MKKSRSRVKKALLIALATVVLVSKAALAGCGGGGGCDAGGGDAGSSDAPEFIKIGIPNPATGPIASFGIGTPWAEQLIETAINDDGGIYIEEYDKKIPIKCYFVDTESDPTKAGEVTQQLITNEDVDILIARHTPDTALPVSQMAETMQVPCVSLECPVEPWLEGGPYEWVYHSFWRVADNCDMFMDMWQELGLGEGTVVGYLFPNDADGLAWLDVFNEKLPENGYVISDPGTYPKGNTDWTAVINKFKADGVEVLTGCDIAPDFASFAAQAEQQGFEYKLVTMGRAFLFPADANANPPEIANGLSNEVWWSPWHPWKSSIDGMTCEELATAYEEKTGEGWSAPMGYKYAGMEIAVDALTRAASLDPEKIRDAIGETDLDTIIGPIKYDPETHVAPTPIVGGQWKLNDAGDAVDLMIVYNKNNTNIPTNATWELPKK
ncbi:MAG: ABC transporter substrate-binding protein [Clostridiales Family XIII bacterium]|jgi:branched-chain amino acid transport system substrate-binding protein|nr:ABC transporter substrate-binding protein [Clostridiales Family XIII bacterium]